MRTKTIKFIGTGCMALALTLSFGKALHAKMMLNKKVAQEDSYNWQVRTPGTENYTWVNGMTPTEIANEYGCEGTGNVCALAYNEDNNRVPEADLERSTF